MTRSTSAPETKSAIYDGDANAAFGSLMNTFETYKEVNDHRIGDLERRGASDVLTVERLDRLEQALQATERKMNDATLRAQRPRLGGEAKALGGRGSSPEHKAAFETYMRGGSEQPLRRLEEKAMSVGSPGDGGYTVPIEIETFIMKRLAQISPIRQIAGNRQVSSPTFQKVFSPTGPQGGWVAETATDTVTTSPPLQQMVFPTMELYAMPSATQQLLDDSIIDIETWLAGEIDTLFAVQEGAAFVNGTGTNQPKGFLQYPTVQDASYSWGNIGYLATGVSGALPTTNPSDILLQLAYELQAGYRQNATWVMARKTQAQIRMLKDSLGHYLWQPPALAGGQASLMSFPLVEAEDMPAIAAGSFSIAFGDFQRGYGRVRISGDIIWATQYEEDSVRTNAGGKGGPSVQSYDYYANFAIGLCAGPINHVARVWADGVELDLTTVTMRVYPGTARQEPDPLILAVQPGGVPAYRDLAYVVFERLPLSNYGNRIPQLNFEVIRCVDTLENRVRAVTMIPGSTEFGYSTVADTSIDATGATVSENRHVKYQATDIAAALDDLQAICPNVERIALVVTWFGDDLRAGTCAVAPRVEANARAVSATWSVSGLSRSTAQAVSYVTPPLAYGASTGTAIAAFGGTPDDASIDSAIREINRRGLKVTLYPFLQMDIPPGNTLPDPYGGTAQATFPWRGRITCSPAAGITGTVDKTATAATQVAHFVGTAAPHDFSVSGTSVIYSGSEWSFRRFLLHYAKLAVAAGGVDAILLSSELRGLTTIRSDAVTYPFVTALTALAADVKSVVGSGTKVSYGADWSEWFGHQPADGSNDVHFHLDPFWSSPNVDFIGIDSYAPLSDWRYQSNLDAAIAQSPSDLAYLRANVLAGEGYDWYYASEADRTAQARTSITDGAYSEPWIFRFKDLPNWWQSQHYDRPGGIRATTPTAWVSRSKPIWLTETGCPAVDLGANQPNMFPDAFSSEAGLPYFSSGARDDLMQRRFCEAVLSAWDGSDPDHLGAAILTTTSGAPFVDPATIHLWTWDARPFPAFPAYATVWADAANWNTGHWLTGRLGGTSVDALVKAILADAGFTEIETEAIGGHIDGYLIDTNMSARSAIEPLLAAWQIDPIDTGTSIRFAGRARQPVATFGYIDLIDPGKSPLLELRRAQETELPHQVAVTVSDVLRDYRRATVTSKRLAGFSSASNKADLPIVAPLDVTLGIADQWLHDLWIGREQVNFALPPQQAAIEPGDIVTVIVGTQDRSVLVTRVTDGSTRAIEGRTIYPALYAPSPMATRAQNAQPASTFGKPTVYAVDIAHLDDTDPYYQPYLAIDANPWPGAMAIWRQVPGGGSYQLVITQDQRSTLGVTLNAVVPGAVSVFDRATTISVRLSSGELASVTEAQMLGGSNLAAVQNTAGLLEVFQFATATLTAVNTYTLSDLLRVQGGSEDAWLETTPAGSPFVLLDDTLLSLPISPDDVGLPLSFRIGPSQDDYTASSYVDLSFTPTARGLLPWSPTDVRGRRDQTSGGVTFTWIRRSRLPGSDAWTTGDVPLGEETEAYQVQILSGGAVVRQIATTSPTLTYPAAQQVADFGALQPAYTIKVAQVSATLGPGVWRTVTIPL